jgi:DNA-binding NarL/FixJ family response regulator
MNAVKIVLAEDHQVVRQGFRALLEAEPDFCVVGEATDGVEAIQLAERLQPDVMVVDLMMPGLSGLEVTARVGQLSPRTRVVILSAFDSEAFVVEALRNGAAGYVLKKSSVTDLARALREAVAGRRYLSPPLSVAGRRYLSPPLSERAIEAYVKYVQKVKSATLDPYETLTPRERETFHLVAEGHTSAEIAERLCISPRTVEAHRANMMRKLGLRTQTDLVRYAMRRGIIPM